jgi:hypothetical protein
MMVSIESNYTPLAYSLQAGGFGGLTIELSGLPGLANRA